MLSIYTCVILAFVIRHGHCSRLTARGTARSSYPFADANIFDSKDPEDAVMAHSLYDPHLEPTDDDSEVEDPSMLPRDGIGFEIEKRDQYREDDEDAAEFEADAEVLAAGTRADAHLIKRSGIRQAAEDDEEQKEEAMDEAEETQHAKSQPPPRKLDPEEAKKLLLSYGGRLEEIVNKIISAHASVPDLLGTQARAAKTEGKTPILSPVAPRSRSAKLQTAAAPSSGTQGIPQPLPPPGPPAMPL
ncbi:hypothetical protein Efla_000604 [Eimeria flavescens]